MCPKKQSSQWLEKHDNLSYSSFDLESLRKSGLGHLIYEDKIWSPALLIENGKDIVGLKKGDFSPIIKRKKEKLSISAVNRKTRKREKQTNVKSNKLPL